MGYDGYGRLKTKHVPQQNAGTVTTWDYNPDDTVQKITDARGSVSNFGYNSRHLVTGITYDPSSGVADTPDVSFGYDPAGNRTSMTDGSGTTAYQYNQLSQLYSESRAFSGLAGSYQLTYEYNLAGQLKKITDPTNVAIKYIYDVGARLTSVNGENTLYGNVSQYASGATYRASGQIKGLAYGNNYTLSVGYNSRLQGSSFEVAYESTALMKTGFEYYPDGSLKFADDYFDEHFDRAYAYDASSRVKEAYSGSEARGFVSGTNQGAWTGPYRHSYQYDAFSNLTQRTGRIWLLNNAFTGGYTNNRRDGFSYDADGRPTLDPDVQYTYGASGQTLSMVNFSTGLNRDLVNDGEGRLAKRIETASGGVGTTNTYYLRSSVLGGKVVTELNGDGQKQKGYVFAGDQLLAEQELNEVNWKYTTPLTGSSATAGVSSALTREAEFDPMGVSVGFGPTLWEPSEPLPESSELSLLGNSSGCGNNPNCTRCSLDGFEIGCDQAQHLLDTNAAGVQASYGGRRIAVLVRSVGLGLFRAWHADPDNPRGPTVDGDIITTSTFADDGMGHWHLFGFSRAPMTPILPKPGPENPTQDRWKGLSGGAKGVPCDVAIPTDINDRAALETLMGEAMYPGTAIYTNATNDGRGNSNYDEVSNPEGYASEDDVYMEMEYMVSVFINRQRDHGYASWYAVANAKQKNGRFQMEGYPAGQRALNNLKAVGDPECEQARRGLRAIGNVKGHGPVRTDIHDWRGVLQRDDRRRPFVRVRQGAIRIAGTDFW